MTIRELIELLQAVPEERRGLPLVFWDGEDYASVDRGVLVLVRDNPREEACRLLPHRPFRDLLRVF